MPGCEGAGAVFVSPSAVVIRELGLTRFIFGVGGGGREAKAKSDSKTTTIDDDDDDDVRRGGLDSTHALTATQVPATAIGTEAHVPALEAGPTPMAEATSTPRKK